MEDRLYLRASEWTDLAAVNALRNEKIAYQCAGGNKYYILEGVCSVAKGHRLVAHACLSGDWLRR